MQSCNPFRDMNPKRVALLYAFSGVRFVVQNRSLREGSVCEGFRYK